MQSGIDTRHLVHDHVFLGESHDANARRTLWVIALTAAMMIGEIVAGLVFNSMALLADGFHMATHAGALAITAAAYAFARRRAGDRRFSFGTGKVGDLAGFTSALLLGVVAVAIAFESAMRLFDPRPVAFFEATVVAAIGLGVNLLSAWLLSGGGGHAHRHDHGHGHDHGGGHHSHDHHDHDHGGHAHGRDNNLRSAFFHVLADALTSLLAIVALLAGSMFGAVWLDPAIGIVGAAVIAVWSWTLLRDTASVLLDRTDPRLEAEIRRIVEAGGPARATDLHVWRVGPDACAAIVSVIGEADADGLRARLCAIPGLAHVTVEAR